MIWMIIRNTWNQILGGRELKIVLSLYPIRTYSGFVSITYQKLFNSLDSLMGNYWRGSNQILDYLMILCRTLKDWKGMIMDGELITFINDNILNGKSIYG